MANPTAQEWHRFWQLDQTRRFGEISWSKRRVLEVLCGYIGSGQAALDAGCGSGFFSDYFCRQGMSTVALDYAPSALERARAATGGRAQIVQADLLNEDISQRLTQRFELIFSDGLLEHFSPTEQDRIMQNLKRVLSPAGYLITFVPNRWSPWELIRPFYMPGIEEDPFTLSRLLELNQRNGLTVAAQGGVNVLPWRVSPERLGPQFGMLLYTVSREAGS